MMSSKFSIIALLITFSALHIHQSQGLALIALSSRPSFLSRIANLNNRRPMAGDIAVTEASVTTIQDEKSATSRPSQIGFEMDSDFDADAYREEMINLVYDRSFDRLVK